MGATITLSVFFNTVMPLINFGFWAKAELKRWIDRSFTNDMKSTKQSLQHDYELLYMGAVF